MKPMPALQQAMDEVIAAQVEKLAIPRRFTTDMKEIWALQPRLLKRAGQPALQLLEHPRFRAGFDFLLLRCDSGEVEREVGAVVGALPARRRGRARTPCCCPTAGGKRKRRRRRAAPAPRRRGRG